MGVLKVILVEGEAIKNIEWGEVTTSGKNDVSFSGNKKVKYKYVEHDSSVRGLKDETNNVTRVEIENRTRIEEAEMEIGDLTKKKTLH